jgi:fused signal recognition particle receptor
MASIFEQWKNGLVKTRNVTFGKIATLFGASDITEDTWDELEALLIQADIGTATTLDMISSMRKAIVDKGIIKTEDYQTLLKEELVKRLIPPDVFILREKPTIILVVGVNGSGKTTTIAKLGAKYQREGKQVLFAAADTFRAAAVDQLKVWGDRLQIQVIAGQENGDPGAVAYDAIQAALNKKTDVVFIDTAGRLHTKYNLMEELKKVHRVVGKALAGAPHAVWIVLDATTGQNAFQQAKMFKEMTKVDGVILSKLDSSSKGGMAFAIQKELGLPILFAGLGERLEDLEPFDPQQFVDGILA